METQIIRKVALALFKEKKIMMLRSNKNAQVFYFAGGTVEFGESDNACLTREITEELNVSLDQESISFLCEFEAPAHGRENTVINIRMYTGKIKGTPEASNEIEEIQYFDSTVDTTFLSEIAIEHVFPWLKKSGYIN